ncbi:hypothetical protein SCLARK_001714 [Spiroplasma clarkii]|uniref:Uncharacterized protein n=1 Tax=Spiroplasma clarkii TaxID=2139 RepID=A0A1Y0L2D1_9MOLU|nr:hypothetical protein [Spiroplasma clarkii]ARU92172.1 hypothetical protein SCLARK_001714 [Spiroplasma clarkii]ATX71503.1 hypothetical protein SCLAR_v1c12030 [Spiroplasma clarkii]
MLTSNQYKKDFITGGSYVLGAIWVTTIVVSIIVIGISFPFPYWWALLFVAPINVGLYVWHVVLVKRIINAINFEKDIKMLTILSFLQLLVLNIPLFAYGLIGGVFYRKTHYTL